MDICCEFKALGDPARLKILRLLSRGRLSVGVIAQRLRLSQPTVSHHLRILREANLVTPTKEGTTVYYALDKKCIAGICCCVKTQFGVE